MFHQQTCQHAMRVQLEKAQSMATLHAPSVTMDMQHRRVELRIVRSVLLEITPPRMVPNADCVPETHTASVALLSAVHASLGL
jgi:hypothetical protein